MKTKRLKKGGFISFRVGEKLLYRMFDKLSEEYEVEKIIDRKTKTITFKFTELKRR